MSNRCIAQEINLDQGKYEYTRYTDGRQIISRYEEGSWVDETGNNYLMAMAHKIEELEKSSKRLVCYQKAINSLDDYFEYSCESKKDRTKVYMVLEKLLLDLREVYQ